MYLDIANLCNQHKKMYVLQVPKVGGLKFNTTCQRVCLLGRPHTCLVWVDLCGLRAIALYILNLYFKNLTIQC